MVYIEFWKKQTFSALWVWQSHLADFQLSKNSTLGENSVNVSSKLTVLVASSDNLSLRPNNRSLANNIFASDPSLFHFLPRHVVYKWVLKVLETNDIRCGDFAIVEGLVNWYRGWWEEEGREKGGSFDLQCCDQSSTPAFCYKMQQNSYPSTPPLVWIGIEGVWGGD